MQTNPRLRPSVLATLLLFGGLACSSQTTVVPGGEGGATGDGGSTSSAATTSGVTVGAGGGGTLGDVNTYSLSIGPLEASPGEESTVCVVLDAGNASAGMLRRVRTELTAGSHHMIVTKIDVGSPNPTPSPCGAFAHGPDALFIAEKPDMALTYPDGSGLPVGANQLIGLEMHYINAVSPSPIDITGTVHLDIADGSADLDEVKLLFVGSLNIHIPAMSTAVVEDHFGLGERGRMFALTSHTHRLGERAAIHRSQGGVVGEMLHESLSWEEPPFDVFDPHVQLEPSDSLYLRCEYNNTTTEDVGFGTGYYDEMCFLWAHYIVDNG